VVRAGAGGRVVERDLRGRAVDGVEVAAAAVALVETDRVVVVALDADDAGGADAVEGPIGMRTEAAEVAEAVALRDLRGGGQERVDGGEVRVRPPQRARAST